MEVLLALSIFSLTLLPFIAIYGQLTEEVQSQAISTQAYWLVYEAAERWKSDSDMEVNPSGLELTITEQLISPTLLEGEFRIRWNNPRGKQELQIRAYKRAATP